MPLTEYHAKFYAHELSRIGGTGVDRLGRALFDACVELNPHQIEAALFALRSPLAKGVLLADEVGLGTFDISSHPTKVSLGSSRKKQTRSFSSPKPHGRQPLASVQIWMGRSRRPNNLCRTQPKR